MCVCVYRYTQHRRRRVSLSALSNYVWHFHAGPVWNSPQYSHTNIHTDASKYEPYLMTQSCDCLLPAMIEPLHHPLQHKSMSITSPENIRHLQFLLIISMAHRHIPFPHQANHGASAHKQQSQGMKQTFKCKPRTLNCIHCVELECVLQQNWNTEFEQPWKWVEAATHAGWPWRERENIYMCM